MGHKDVATGRGVLSLRSFVSKALELFLIGRTRPKAEIVSETGCHMGKAISV